MDLRKREKTREIRQQNQVAKQEETTKKIVHYMVLRKVTQVPIADKKGYNQSNSIKV